MDQDRTNCKLITIFRANVVGYSRLMGEDEAAPFKTLEIYTGGTYVLDPPSPLRQAQGFGGQVGGQVKKL